MLQRDYITEMTKRFCSEVNDYLKTAVLDGDYQSIGEVEDAVGRLLDLDGASALSLDATSLTAIMELSGIADSLGSYVAYSLSRVADAYEKAGDMQLAAIRREQASAVADAFCYTLGEVPEEFADLDRELSSR